MLLSNNETTLISISKHKIIVVLTVKTSELDRKIMLLKFLPKISIDFYKYVCECFQHATHMLLVYGSHDISDNTYTSTVHILQHYNRVGGHINISTQVPYLLRNLE